MSERLFSQQAHDYQVVEQAIHFLEANFRRQPSLDEMAASVHLSKYHFQKLFKRWAGISPTQFLHFLTLEYAKETLRQSRSVLDAALESGLSSPGRLHDLFVTFEAITPGQYKQRGAGLQVAYGFHETPFGRCLLATTARGICALYFVPDGDGKSTLEELMAHWPQAVFSEEPLQTEPLAAHIFARGPHPRPLHLMLKGTNFQVKVWQALLAIPPGAMVSYQALAASVGRPRASRAVGQAVGQNQVAYLIPCHRVISQAGQTHHYHWGDARKKAMLVWEAGHKSR
jgi:AraC family transcriptional regulator of adaptative response/methylated-DNA-[protein]-cysteine methyltransferase